MEMVVFIYQFLLISLIFTEKKIQWWTFCMHKTPYRRILFLKWACFMKKSHVFIARDTCVCVSCFDIIFWFVAIQWSSASFELFKLFFLYVILTLFIKMDLFSSIFLCMEYLTGASSTRDIDFFSCYSFFCFSRVKR